MAVNFIFRFFAQQVINFYLQRGALRAGDPSIPIFNPFPGADYNCFTGFVDAL
jgi:hypothetical protein